MDFENPCENELMDYLRRKYIEEMRERNSGLKKAQDKLLAEPLKVTPEAFFEYMDAKGISSSCKLCGSNRISIPVGSFMKLIDTTPPDADEDNLVHERVKFASFSYLTDTNGDVSLIRPYYMRHCENCGHLDLFRASTVLEWVESQGKQDKEGGDDASS